jgi:hypothetical protein
MAGRKCRTCGRSYSDEEYEALAQDEPQRVPAGVLRTRRCVCGSKIGVSMTFDEPVDFGSLVRDVADDLCAAGLPVRRRG